MPGDKAKVLEKAKTLPADTLMFDLEDAVAPDNKPAAREAVVAATKAGGYGQRELVIRINGLDTEWGQADLEAAVAAGPDAVLVPKVETGDDIKKLDAALSKAGAKDTLGLWVMIEMPKAVLNIQEIAAAAETTRLAAFVMGTNDLAKEYRALWTPDRLAFQTALSLSVAAARGYGLLAIDGVYNDIQNLDGLRAECEQGRVLGFDGKTLIHPAQLDITNEVFSPAAEDIAQAQAVIAAFDLPENKGKGVIKVNGKMTELLHLDEARQTVAIANAIAAMGGSSG
jgi:citrate lyase subunit beta/citryl-CoA lyase